jgi:hypothetical protein
VSLWIYPNRKSSIVYDHFSWIVLRHSSSAAQAIYFSIVVEMKTYQNDSATSQHGETLCSDYQNKMAKILAQYEE